MKNSVLILSILLLPTVSCIYEAQSIESHNTEITEEPGLNWYNQAAGFIQNKQLDSAMRYLELALDTISDNMRLINDIRFYPLLDNPIYRPRIRELLWEHVNQSEANMVRKEESGERITIYGKILDSESFSMLKHVQIELVQADSEGKYFEEKSSWNPRIFAYLSSFDDGTFKVTTIKPGNYFNDEGQEETAHMHYRIKLMKYQEVHSEFIFDDDPQFLLNGNEGNVPVARKLKGRKNAYEVTLMMQRMKGGC